MKVFIVLVLLLCNHSLGDGYSTVDAQWKTWKYDADISNPVNWVGGKIEPDCKGIIFAENNGAPIFLEKIQVEELVLPKNGDLWLLDSGFIQFGGKGDDTYVDSNKDYCVRLKPIEYNYWYDWRSWLLETNNSAVPHQERIPCFYDYVNFPNAYHTRTVIDDIQDELNVARLKFGIINENKDDFRLLQDSEIGRAVFLADVKFAIKVNSKATCPDPEWPCPCHLEYIPCFESDELLPEVFECENPIQPYGFCHGICGAFVTIKLEKRPFDMGKLKKMLEGYESDTHASVLRDDWGDYVVQVVFAEKEYRMKSTMEIEDFHAKLLEQKMPLEDYVKSGLVYIKGKTGSTTVALIFGTFFGVLLVFVIVFTVFKDGGDARWFATNYFRTRFNSRSFFDPLVFARFDTQNENLIVDGQSLAGSVQNLHQSRSFDNPMFGGAPSREQQEEAPQSVSLLPSLVPQKSTEETNEVENPLYDIALKTVNEE